MTATVVVRKAVEADAEGLAGVLCRALQAAYLGTTEPEDVPASRRRLAVLSPAELVDGARDVLAGSDASDWTVVAELDRVIVGFQRLRTHPIGSTPDDGEIASLYVDPTAWSAGSGGRLLEEGLRQLAAAGCQRAWLWVAAENARARRFYAKHGFAPDGAEDTARLEPWGVDLGFDLDLVRLARGLTPAGRPARSVSGERDPDGSTAGGAPPARFEPSGSIPRPPPRQR